MSIRKLHIAGNAHADFAQMPQGGLRIKSRETRLSKTDLALVFNRSGVNSLQSEMNRIRRDLLYKTIDSPKSLGTVGGYPVVQYTDTYKYDKHVVIAFDGERPIAFLRVKPWRNVVSFAVVDREYQGRGIGYALHELYLKKRGFLSSSFELSKGSAIVWKKIATKFPTYLALRTPKITLVSIHSWTEDGGIPVPMVQTAQGPRTLRELQKLGQSEASRRLARTSHLIALKTKHTAVSEYPV